jgi:hypothetical protein
MLYIGNDGDWKVGGDRAWAHLAFFVIYSLDFRLHFGYILHSQSSIISRIHPKKIEALRCICNL